MSKKERAVAKRKKKWDGISNFFRANSIWMLMYCTGCCAIELPQAMTSKYDMERLGMGPMATPRQADVILVTGYLSVKTLRRVIYAYEQMGEPKYLVAFGPCTINGGIYYAESDRTTRCRFLGRQATFPSGPLLLASLLKVSCQPPSGRR